MKPTKELAQKLDDIWEYSREQQQARARRRSEPPVIRLWDGDFDQCALVRNPISATFTWIMNDTGHARLVLDYEDKLGQWLVDPWGRAKQNVHITADKDGARWSGRLAASSIVRDEGKPRYIMAQFLHDYEELKYVALWANPVMPATVQFPKTFIMAGPTKWVALFALALNNFRYEGNLYQIPDDLLNPTTWADGVQPWKWQIRVQPHSLLKDNSLWTIAHARFQTWHEVFAPKLRDAGLMVVTRRWLKGDPAPYPGAICANGNLFIDIVDKSGVFEGTALAGNIFAGMYRSVVKVADDGFTELITDLGAPKDVPDFPIASWLGTSPHNPWVVYRDGAHSNVQSFKWTWQPATAATITIGGKSAPGVNEVQETAIKIIGDIFSNLVLGQGGVGDILNTVLKPLYTDTLAAWVSVKHPLRPHQLGKYHYREIIASTSQQAMTLSMVMAIKSALWATRARSTHVVQVADGAPYLIGDNGQGHFFLGDRIGIAVEGLPSHSLMVEQVTEITYSLSRESRGWAVTVGDPRSQEEPTMHALRQIRELTGSLHDVGLL